MAEFEPDPVGIFKQHVVVAGSPFTGLRTAHDLGPEVLYGLTHFSSLDYRRPLFFRIPDCWLQIVRPGISGVEAKVTAQIAIREAPVWSRN